jgi:hypothetical protein
LAELISHRDLLASVLEPFIKDGHDSPTVPERRLVSRLLLEIERLLLRIQQVCFEDNNDQLT